MLGIPHTEIDALFHGPDWTPHPEFVADVRALVAQDAWVTEWQYAPARPLLAARADLLVWLDRPFATVTLPRVIARTLRRRLGRVPLWNGNIGRSCARSSPTPSTSCGGRSPPGTSIGIESPRWTRTSPSSTYAAHRT
ncbi:hypothetical protein [Microbacterium trichothecenolyticum]|uniref:Uncharacterized protein n=1 Tax=Microbacterium trichothecenolyticum TaxID=69370 RepID=A0ABU0TXP4_MICTR|nr:hypothetical protein [Microbacterium trichothecenolyticum]MDQ1124432.1 hypothetical protein [Microbacterium trichothecenolyticum]